MAKTNDFSAQSKALDLKQAKLLKEMKEKRATNVRHRIAFEAAQRDRQIIEGELIIEVQQELMTDPEALTVPGVGGTTENWFFKVLQDRIVHKDRMIAATKKLVKTQEDLYASEQDMLDTIDELNVVNRQSDRLAAEMRYLGE